MTFASTSHRRIRLPSILILGLFLTACGGSSDSPTSMDDGMGMPPVMVDLGQWNIIEEDVQGVIWELGFENTTHGLRVRFDPQGGPVSLTDSSPTHQPAVEATWRGEYWGYYLFNDRFDGDAEIDVTIQGSNVTASVTYSDFLGNQGWDITSDPAAVVDGRFALTGDVTFSDAVLPFTGEGQFGGTDQRGVVGYITSDEFTSAFYGDRN